MSGVPRVESTRRPGVPAVLGPSLVVFAASLALGGCVPGGAGSGATATAGGGDRVSRGAGAGALAPTVADGLTPEQQAEIEAAVAAYQAANERAAAQRVEAAQRAAAAAETRERVSWLDPGGTGAGLPEADLEPGSGSGSEPDSAPAPVQAASPAGGQGGIAAVAEPASQSPVQSSVPSLAPAPPAEAQAPEAFASPAAVTEALVPAVARGASAPAGQDAEPAGSSVPALPPAVSAPGMVEIAAVELCRSVGGFGVYEPFPDNTFAAGVPVRMVLYTEIDGFSTDVGADDSMHHVRLSQEVLLFRDADGQVVWNREPEAIRDESRRMRRDFWSVQLVELPATLGVGRYRLKVRITDEVSGTVDERSVPLRLVATGG